MIITLKAVKTNTLFSIDNVKELCYRVNKQENYYKLIGYYQLILKDGKRNTYKIQDYALVRIEDDNN